MIILNVIRFVGVFYVVSIVSFFTGRILIFMFGKYLDDIVFKYFKKY